MASREKRNSQLDQQRVTKILLGCGAAGAFLFVFVFFLDGATRSDYNPVYHPVSALSLGDRGWIQIANFVTAGLLMVAFSVGLRRALHTGHGQHGRMTLPLGA